MTRFLPAAPLRGLRLAVGLAISLAFGLPLTAFAAADYAIVNARIDTQNEWAPWAHAIAVSGDKIVYVGEPGTDEWKNVVGPSTKIHDLQGKLVLPGFIDSHTHPGLVMLSSWHTILPWTMDPHEQLRFLRDWAKAHPDRPVIDAEMYPTQMFGAAGPTRQLIDQYIPDRAVIWEDFSGHSVALNSRALKLMGIDKNTPDPEPGVSYFVRDKDGNPTGWAKENAAGDFLPKLYKAVKWSPPLQVTADGLATTLDYLTTKGVMAVFDARTEEGTLQALSQLERAHRLHLYYEGSVLLQTRAEVSARLDEVRDLQRKYGSKHLRINTLKLFLDGTNELATSSLLEPFTHEPNKRVDPRMSKDDLLATLLDMNERGVDMHIHMTGDRAFRTALDAVQGARAKLGDKWRIQVSFAHCELISDQDFARVAPLGVIINWTPHWSGGYFQGVLETLGPVRHANLYRFQPIISLGGTVTFGSDTTTMYEWSRADPFFGMQIAHTRFDVEPRYQAYGMKAPASEMLQLTDLVRGYTRNGAKQLRLSDKMGSIEPGKLANFMVMNQDLFEVAADKIHETAPTAVVFEGDVVKGSL